MILDRLFGQHPEYMIAEPGRALLISAVRLMDKTVTEYLAARQAALTFIDGQSENRAGRPSDYFRVLDHLETCIGVLHRTILHLDAIKARKDAPSIDRTKRNALNAATAQINQFRDKIEHADEELRKNPGAVPYPVLCVDSDSFRLGSESVTYADFGQWIGQTSSLLRTLLPS